MNNKQIKIWGMSYGLIGDLVMGLPLLNYFEKKYPNSYKYWVIEKKCSFTSPLYLNHPLIDRIKITDEWGLFGKTDLQLVQNCDIVCGKVSNHVKGGGPASWHDSPDWFNTTSCVEETAKIAGIYDIKEVLTEEELKPKLYKWFDVGLPESVSTYSRANENDLSEFENNIAIWPFATGEAGNRSPSKEWWGKFISKAISSGYSVYHYGRHTEPTLSSPESSRYKNLTYLPYFEQVKASLASKLVIGTDSGSQWVMGAYSHPAINLITNWLPNHNYNLLGLAPINDNGVNIFEKGGCDNISTDAVLDNIKERVVI
jgi:ADP-heptose:LPS heptosyltransferase